MTTSASNAHVVDLTNFEEPLDQLLACLHNLRIEKNRKWSSAAELAVVLRDEWGVRIHWRTADKLLFENGTYVDRRKRNKRWEFFLLASGIERVRGASAHVVLVDPCKAVQATVELHELLGSTNGTLRVCDPYLDSTTLEHLDACEKGTEVRFLSLKIRDSGKARRILKALKDTGRDIQVKRDSAGDLHDRYILDESRMTIFGTSLNGFGRKQTFVVRVGEDVRSAMAKDFDERWGSGATWP